jgi:hypothetical protein
MLPALREKIASTAMFIVKNFINLRYLYLKSDAFGTLWQGSFDIILTAKTRKRPHNREGAGRREHIVYGAMVGRNPPATGECR